MRVIRCSVLACLVACLLVLLMQPGTARAGECTSWNTTQEIRCLSTGAPAFTRETLRLRNRSNTTVSFSLQQWFSSCGWPSNRPATVPIVVVLAPGQTIDQALQPFPMAAPADADSYCTETFIFACSNGACRGSIVAQLSPETATQPRPCLVPTGEPSDLRCLSRADAAERGETVVIRNLTQHAVTFEQQQWDSDCGLLGSAQELRPGRLQAGQSTTVKLWANTRMSAVLTDTPPCTEFYISSCAAGYFRPCAEVLSATISD